jgi:hypothetical protein
MVDLPFVLATDGLLEPRAVLETGAIHGPADGAPPHHPRAVPLLVVAWHDEPAGVTLEHVVGEDVARLLTGDGAVVLDRERVAVAGVPAVRTFTLRRGPGGLPTAAEQWRLVAAGRRWTLSAMTALADQPEWGPRLARVATGIRIAT